MPAKIDAKAGLRLSEYDKRRISERVRKARQEEGLTLQQLADAVGCSLPQLSHVENGDNLPSLDLYVALARYFRMGRLPMLGGSK